MFDENSVADSDEIDIDEMVQQHPLPSGVEDLLLNRSDLAQAFNVSLNTVDKWIMAGMPVEKGGTNGQAYQLRLSACWAWKQHRDQVEETEKEAKLAAVRQLRLQMVGGESGDSVDSLSPGQKREIFQTQTAYEDFRRQRGELMHRKEVEEMLTDVFKTLRDAVIALPDTLEQKAHIDPKAAALVESICDNALESMSAQTREFFGLRPVNRIEQKADLFDA